MSEFELLPVSKRQYENESPIFLPVSEWEFTKHANYWIITKLFKEGGLDLFKAMAKCYPIVDKNNDDDHIDHNPFQVHHMPLWFATPICDMVREFVLREYFKQGPDMELIHERQLEWGNIYIKGECRPLTNSYIPHCPFVADSVEWRWSHCFGFKYKSLARIFKTQELKR